MFADQGIYGSLDAFFGGSEVGHRGRFFFYGSSACCQDQDGKQDEILHVILVRFYCYSAEKGS
jgi:hypothetical protein